MKSIFGILFSILLFFTLTIVSFELISKFLSGQNPVYKGLPLSESAKKYLIPFEISFLKTENLVTASEKNVLVDRTKIRYEYKTQNFENYSESNARAFNQSTNDLIFDVIYRVTRGKQRIPHWTPYKKRSETALVFIGCSFTFGDGVNYGETVAGQFASNFSSKMDIYNLGRSAGAANDFIPDLDSVVIKRIKSYKKIILVYTYIDQHIFRIACSLKCLTEPHKYYLNKPRYALDESEQLQFIGTHGDTFKKNFLTTFIFDRKLFEQIDIPPVFTEKNYLLMSRILETIYDGIKADNNELKAFFVYGWGNRSEEINQSLPFVLRTKFNPLILDYYEKEFRYGLAPYHIPFDGHPSALGHKAVYEGILWKLRQAEPDVFN